MPIRDDRICIEPAMAEMLHPHEWQVPLFQGIYDLQIVLKGYPFLHEESEAHNPHGQMVATQFSMVG